MLTEATDGFQLEAETGTATKEGKKKSQKYNLKQLLFFYFTLLNFTFKVEREK